MCPGDTEISVSPGHTAMKLVRTGFNDVPRQVAYLSQQPVWVWNQSEPVSATCLDRLLTSRCCDLLTPAAQRWDDAIHLWPTYVSSVSSGMMCHLTSDRRWGQTCFDGALHWINIIVSHAQNIKVSKWIRKCNENIVYIPYSSVSDNLKN